MTVTGTRRCWLTSRWGTWNRRQCCHRGSTHRSQTRGFIACGRHNRGVTQDSMRRVTTNRGWAAAGLLGAVLSIGWVGGAGGVVLPAFTGSPPGSWGDGVALGIVVFGVLLLAAIAAVGARSAWKHAFY